MCQASVQYCEEGLEQGSQRVTWHLCFAPTCDTSDVHWNPHAAAARRLARASVLAIVPRTDVAEVATVLQIDLIEGDDDAPEKVETTRKKRPDGRQCRLWDFLPSR